MLQFRCAIPHRFPAFSGLKLRRLANAERFRSGQALSLDFHTPVVHFGGACVRPVYGTAF